MPARADRETRRLDLPTAPTSSGAPRALLAPTCQRSPESPYSHFPLLDKALKATALFAPLVPTKRVRFRDTILRAFASHP